MADTSTIIAQAYAAFNRRDIDAALALMTHDVSWPRASEGGKVIGKEAIRAYWTRQWSEFDPHVDPLDLSRKSPVGFTCACTSLSRTCKAISSPTAWSSTSSPSRRASS